MQALKAGNNTVLFYSRILLMVSASNLLNSCTERIEPLKDNWESAIPWQETPDSLVSIRAFDCGICHQEIYQEWKLSTHAHAWTDLQFQAELRKESSPYLCINCHIPLENQQEFLVKGLRDGDIYQPVMEPNPGFDPIMQEEGISCSTCHIRDGYVIGLKGDTQAPHPVRVDSAFLNEQLCMSCHNAHAAVTPELVCTFETGNEWMSGPYYGKKNCIDCHMDTVTRSLVFGYPSRPSHRHWFPGSGIPKRSDVETVGLQGMAYYPDTLLPRYQIGDTIPFGLRLVNAEAGHRLPSGDPERFYLIKLAWLNSVDRTLITSDTFRIGETWEWYPEARKLADNNFAPLEERTYPLLWVPGSPGKYLLSIEVSKHRMDEATAAYNQLTEEYPIFITEFSQEQEVEVISQ